MNIYLFRVILDTEADVFRDIEIGTNSDFETFHNLIKESFGFHGNEIASFYLSDEDWNRGREIPLLDMSDSGSVRNKKPFTMATVKIGDLVQSPSEKILYVYDFLRMWCFYIELVSVRAADSSVDYPRISLYYGESPAEDSKEFDLGLGLTEEPVSDDSSEKTSFLTGDPEIDEFLEEDDPEEEDFGNIDDLDDRYY